MRTILPDGFQLTWEADGDTRWTTLSWEISCDDGLVRKSSVSWDYRPTDEQLQIAVDYVLANPKGDIDAGQGVAARRAVWFGRVFYLFHMTGPPTWWLPRFLPNFKERSLVVGWLQQGFGISYEGKATW